jgi:hypothetical protein
MTKPKPLKYTGELDLQGLHKVAPMSKCGTCKHWSKDGYPETYGTCNAIEMWDKGLFWKPTPKNRGPLAYVQDASDYHASLYTRAEFGCVMHEEK